MTFREAQLRLLAYLVDRIHNGELTERRLARLIGISQPHAHNVLKGIRNFSSEIGDAVLNYFNLSILDLASDREIEANLKRRRPVKHDRDFPFMKSAIGPGMPWPAEVDRRAIYAGPVAAGSGESGLLMANLAADPEMYRSLAGADIALLDTSERARLEVSPAALYVISRGGEAVIRQIRPGARGFYLVTDAVFDSPSQWEYVNVPAAEFGRFVKARIRWLGRGGDHRLPPQRERAL